jgi:hypothetical protein
MFKGSKRPHRFFGLKAWHTTRNRDPALDTPAGGEAGDHRLAFVRDSSHAGLLLATSRPAWERLRAAGRGLRPVASPRQDRCVSRPAACVRPARRTASRPAQGWGGVRWRGEATGWARAVGGKGRLIFLYSKPRHPEAAISQANKQPPARSTGRRRTSARPDGAEHP